METRIAVKDLQPGMLLVRCGKREFNSTVRDVRAVPAGYPVKGPRGGKYALTAHGASQLLAVTTGSGQPMLRKDATAVVFVNEEV